MRYKAIRAFEGHKGFTKPLRPGQVQGPRVPSALKALRLGTLAQRGREGEREREREGEREREFSLSLSLSLSLPLSLGSHPL